MRKKKERRRTFSSTTRVVGFAATKKFSTYLLKLHLSSLLMSLIGLGTWIPFSSLAVPFPFSPRNSANSPVSGDAITILIEHLCSTLNNMRNISIHSVAFCAATPQVTAPILGRNKPDKFSFKCSLSSSSCMISSRAGWTGQDTEAVLSFSPLISSLGTAPSSSSFPALSLLPADGHCAKDMLHARLLRHCGETIEFQWGIQGAAAGFDTRKRDKLSNSRAQPHAWFLLSFSLHFKCQNLRTHPV